MIIKGQPITISVDDNSIMFFGKYQGRRLAEIPESYLEWLWNETDIQDALKDNTDRGALARYLKLALLG